MVIILVGEVQRETDERNVGTRIGWERYTTTWTSQQTSRGICCICTRFVIVSYAKLHMHIYGGVKAFKRVLSAMEVGSR